MFVCVRFKQIEKEGRKKNNNTANRSHSSRVVCQLSAQDPVSSEGGREQRDDRAIRDVLLKTEEKKRSVDKPTDGVLFVSVSLSHTRRRTLWSERRGRCSADWELTNVPTCSVDRRDDSSSGEKRKGR